MARCLSYFVFEHIPLYNTVPSVCRSQQREQGAETKVHNFKFVGHMLPTPETRGSVAEGIEEARRRNVSRTFFFGPTRYLKKYGPVFAVRKCSEI